MDTFVKPERYINDVKIAKAAGQHAMSEYPNESVGAVVEGVDGLEYLPLENVADDPTNAFKIGPNHDIPMWAIIHSHTMAKTTHPSLSDMHSQQASAIPYGILHSDGKIFSPVQWFGDELPIQPLIGREFVNGYHDCWTIVRDVHRQFGIVLENPPRNDNWYHDDPDFNILKMENFDPIGFVLIKKSEAREGDVVLGKAGRSSVLNHCGVLAANGLVIHQLGDGPSRRENMTPWWRHIAFVGRHKHFITNPEIIPKIEFNR